MDSLTTTILAEVVDSLPKSTYDKNQVKVFCVTDQEV